MKKIDVFDLQKEVEDKVLELSRARNFDEALEAFCNMGDAFLHANVRLQSLENAACDELSVDQLKEVGKKRSKLVEEWTWRGVSKEDREALAKAGLKDTPVILVKGEEYRKYLEENSPVLLIKDASLIATKNVDEVEEHVKSGGLIGVSSFAYEKDLDLLLDEVMEEQR